MVVQTMLSGLIMLIIFWFGVRDTDARELEKKLDDKADKIEVEAVKSEMTKSDEEVRIYVDQRFDRHIYHEQQMFNNFEKLMKQSFEAQKELLESVDNRLQRIENKVYD